MTLPRVVPVARGAGLTACLLSVMACSGGGALTRPDDVNEVAPAVASAGPPAAVTSIPIVTTRETLASFATTPTTPSSTTTMTPMSPDQPIETVDQVRELLDLSPPAPVPIDLVPLQEALVAALTAEAKGESTDAAFFSTVAAAAPVGSVVHPYLFCPVGRGPKCGATPIDYGAFLNTCVTGGSTLMTAIVDDPPGWAATGVCVLTPTADEIASTQAVVAQSWTAALNFVGFSAAIDTGPVLTQAAQRLADAAVAIAQIRGDADGPYASAEANVIDVVGVHSAGWARVNVRSTDLAGARDSIERQVTRFVTDHDLRQYQPAAKNARLALATAVASGYWVVYAVIVFDS